MSFVATLIAVSPYCLRVYAVIPEVATVRLVERELATF
jgi:hypothetical protein